MEHLDATDIKRANRNRVYRFLQKGGIFSKREISNALDMSYPTVTKNLSELQEMALVNEIGALESTGGRKAVGVELNADARCAVGLDVTRNHVAVLILNLLGEVQFWEREKIPFSKDPSYFRRLGGLVDEALEKKCIHPDKVLGVGISVPAIIAHDRVTLSYSSVLGSSGISQQNFAEYLRYPCKICNDAKAAASAECHVEGQPDHMVYFSLSNSVGGAIILKNRILMGNHDRSAEVGHIKVVQGGERCYCGQRGCLDAYCNAMVLSKYEGGNLERFFEKLQQGSEEYQALWEEYEDHLASALDKVITTFDWPVMLGGYVGSYLEPYIPEILRRVREISTYELEDTAILACKRKLEASAVGAAYLYLDPFLRKI